MEAEPLSLTAAILTPDKDCYILQCWPRVSKRKVIELSKDALEEYDGEPIHVSELARIAGVSERPLITTFNEYYLD
jgi:hypothetical protein